MAIIRRTHTEWVITCLAFMASISTVSPSALPIENWKENNFIPIDQDIKEAADPIETMDSSFPDDVVVMELDMLFKKDEWSEIESNGYYDDYEYVDEDYVDYFYDGYSEAKVKPRNAIKDKRWPDKTVPYEIPIKTFDKLDRREIQAAIEDISKYSCVKFRQTTESDVNSLVMQNGAGCQSHVGMDGGKQPFYLSKKCRKKRTVMHELLHALGFPHEQNRPNRDQYITIMTENIKPGKEHNFKRYKIDDIADSGVGYDYGSLMHYGQRAFSKSEQPTMVTKDKKYQDVIGEATGLSFKDIKEINIRYSCNSHCPKTTCKDGFVGKDCQCWCRGMSDDEPVVHCSSNSAIKDSCHDTVARCPRLADIGYCETRKDYMKKTCPKSCGFCSNGLCVDRKSQCKQWKDDGFCNSPQHTKYMSENCARSCESCKAEDICADFSTGTECKIWKFNGLCDSNNEHYGFMTGNCAKTCGFCKEKVEDCVDKVPDRCPDWQASGYCQDSRYKSYMLHHCAKSCSVCAPTPPKPEQVLCKDVNANCGKWKKDGFCVQEFYKKYMREQCPSTCGFCP